MLAIERKSRIIQYLQEKGQAEVSELSTLLGVVPETIRRDLKELEKQGTLSRTHGGAIFHAQGENEYPLLVRETQNRKEKDMLCACASEYIDDGDVLFVDNSSTTVNLIKYISMNKRITIITNSIFLLLEYSKQNYPNITMVCTGGVYNSANQSLTGSLSMKIARDFLPNKAMISCRGFSTKNGFTENGIYETDIKQSMIKIARETFILMDHTKIGKSGSAILGGANICSTLITDEEPPADIIKCMTSENVKIRVS